MAIEEVVVRVHIFEEFLAINYRDHCVEAGQIGERSAVFVGEAESGSYGHGFGDAGGFNEEVIVAVFCRQQGYLFEEVFTQGAADTAVGHLNQFFVGTNESGVDVDLAHVVDDDRNFEPFTIVEDVIEEGGFACSKKAGKNGDGKSFSIAHSLSLLHEGS